MIPWFTKYSPKSIGEIPQENAQKLSMFVKSFRRGQALLIHGPPGSGKSAAVHALAEEAGLELLEVNASDTRNASSIEETIGGALKQGSLFGRGKLIFIDEVDGVSGTNDRGGVQAIAGLLGTNAFPVILCANDPFDKKFSSLRKACAMIEFSEVSVDAGVKILSNICEKENVKYDMQSLRHLFRRNAGDIRGSLTDIQVLSAIGNISMESIKLLSERSREETMEQALTKVLKTRSYSTIDAFDLVTENIDDIFLWLEENVSREYSGEDVARGISMLARADVFRSRIQKRQYWRFLATIFPMVSAGISLAKTASKRTPPLFRDPTELFVYWRLKNERSHVEDVSSKIAKHISTKRFSSEILPYLALWVSRDKTAWKSVLSSDDLEWLGKKI